MNKLILQEEILRQLSLMNFDSSKTISEQKVLDIFVPLLMEAANEPEPPKTTAEIKAFQDYMDTIGPWVKSSTGKYVKLNKGAGYGTYGDNTRAAWKVYGQGYLNGISKKTNTGYEKTVGDFKKMTGNVTYGELSNSDCPYGYRQLSSEEVKSLSNRIDNPLNSTTTPDEYVQTDSGCQKPRHPASILHSLAEASHYILPVLALIANIALPGVGGYLVGAIIELGDASVYYAQGNYTAAGVGAVCAILPWGTLIKYTSIKTLGKIGLKRLVGKLGTQGAEATLTQLEKDALEELGSASIRRELTYEIAKQSLKVILKKTTLGKFLNVLWVLVRGGFIVADFLKTPLGIVYGLSVTFEYLLKLYGVTTDEDIEELQNTSVIDENTNIDPTQNISSELKSIFAKFVLDGKQFSIKNKDTYNLDVLFIQLFLKNSEDLEYPAGTTVQVKDKKIIVKDNLLLSKVSMFTVGATLIKTINVKGVKDKTESFTWPFDGDDIKTNQVLLLKIEDINGESELRKVFYGAGSIYGGLISADPIIKWGYFDKSTQQLVAALQEQHNISGGMDGIIGKNTLTKMVELIDSSTFINNNSGKNITFKDINSRILTVDEISTKAEEKQITKVEIEEVYESNKDKIADSMSNYFVEGIDEKTMLKQLNDTLVNVVYPK
jgi:hypothetical protein